MHAVHAAHMLGLFWHRALAMHADFVATNTCRLRSRHSHA